MEDNDDWSASNKTLKKWTRIGDGELLSYAGINYHKPIDKERLIKGVVHPLVDQKVTPLTSS
jgi:hypothetical protein